MRIVIVLLLIVIVGLAGWMFMQHQSNAASIQMLRNLESLREQEQQFATDFAEQTFTIGPFGDAQFFEPSDERGGAQAASTLTVVFDADDDSGRQSAHGDWDPGAWKFTGFRKLGDIETSADAESLMAGLLTQVGGAHPNWHVARLMPMGAGSMGFASHPAGMITICAIPEGRENRWSIGYSFTLMSAPARNGIVGRTGDIGSMQIGKQFFRPSKAATEGAPADQPAG